MRLDELSIFEVEEIETQSEPRQALEPAMQAGGRKSHLEYKEKLVKGKLDRVTLELSGKESEITTKLSKKYKEINDLEKQISEKRDLLNLAAKQHLVSYFDAEDEVLTRVLETVSMTLTLSKKSVEKVTTTTIDFEGFYKEILILLPELEDKLKILLATYTKTTTTKDERSPALRVKLNEPEPSEEELKKSAKNALKKESINEADNDFWNKIQSMGSKLLSIFKVWGRQYDKKLAMLKQKMGEFAVEESNEHLSEEHKGIIDSVSEEYDIPVSEMEEVASKLSKKTHMHLSAGDFARWYSGSKSRAFDMAIIKLLGKDAIWAGEVTARLPHLLYYALGMGQRYVGGIDMKALLKTKRDVGESNEHPPAADNPLREETFQIGDRVSVQDNGHEFLGIIDAIEHEEGYAVVENLPGLPFFRRTVPLSVIHDSNISDEEIDMLINDMENRQEEQEFEESVEDSNLKRIPGSKLSPEEQELLYRFCEKYTRGSGEKEDKIELRSKDGFVFTKQRYPKEVMKRGRWVLHAPWRNLGSEDRLLGMAYHWQSKQNTNTIDESAFDINMGHYFRKNKRTGEVKVEPFRVANLQTLYGNIKGNDLGSKFTPEEKEKLIGIWNKNAAAGGLWEFYLDNDSDKENLDKEGTISQHFNGKLIHGFKGTRGDLERLKSENNSDKREYFFTPDKKITEGLHTGSHDKSDLLDETHNARTLARKSYEKLLELEMLALRVASHSQPGTDIDFEYIMANKFKHLSFDAEKIFHEVDKLALEIDDHINEVKDVSKQVKAVKEALDSDTSEEMDVLAHRIVKLSRSVHALSLEEAKYLSKLLFNKQRLLSRLSVFEILSALQEMSNEQYEAVKNFVNSIPNHKIV
jgi:hypothetical protein